MKNFLKGTLFIAIFIALFYFFSYLCLPKENTRKFGFYKTSSFEILSEKDDTIDAIVLGDSLVYASVIPMEIYGEYGYTVYDCAGAAEIFRDAYEYFKVAAESQHPKLLIIEGNIFFRDERKRPKDERAKMILSNYIPLIVHHDNWKKLLLSHKENINVDKGYIYNKRIEPSKNFNYMEELDKKTNILDKNVEFFEKLLEVAKEHNVKIVIMGFPSQKSWYQSKHVLMQEFADKYGIEFIDLNYEESLNIDWTVDTKDEGSHLNYTGAKKVSKYIGNYLHEMGIFEDHRNDPKYADWNTAYKIHNKEKNK